MNPTLAWTILLAPLIASVVITLLTLHRPRLSAWLSVGSILIAFLASCWLFVLALRRPESFPWEAHLVWITLPGCVMEWGLLLDPLSLLMCLVVTGVGSAIFCYSIGYMAGEAGFARYFAKLAFFAFAMLGIVLANNWVFLFVAWELVGLASYLLIGFWFERPAAAEAGKKAFLVNRLADVGFLTGIIMLWVISGTGGAERTFNFLALEGRSLPPEMLTLIGLLLFAGVIGKSAQLPLHVWLPDAMEGPTPVSALIHAATMVAAGVYLLCRAFFLFATLPHALTVIAWVGGCTAAFAACLALVQSDIKRILAYSTISQLGYMVLALGLGGYTAGMYHLTTHAFFKALLFLGAGSVIHSLHTNEIWQMGGLLRRMPVTGWTFLVGTLALCGIFPLSGFWSKDEILAVAYGASPPLFWMAAATAGLTAFYMGRCLCVVFFGRPTPTASHAHESPAIMTLPLVLLAVLAMVGGFLGIPYVIGHRLERHAHFEPVVMAISLAVAMTGLGLAWVIYNRRWISAAALARRWPGLYRFLRERAYIDTVYDWIVRYVQGSVAALCAAFERWIIIGCFVNGTAFLTRTTGRWLRLCQTGVVQTYGIVFLAGLLGMLLWWAKHLP